MKCPKCQAANREGVKFCEECGARLELTCPGCGAAIPLGKRFCGECGKIVVEPKAPHHVDYSQPRSYTPKHLAEKILAARTSMEGERKQVTVLFADVKGFTSISEKLDPEDVQTLISECLILFTEEIHRYEGAIAQFLGDGVMALFGAPIAHEDAPQRALYAALAIWERLREYSEKLKKQGIDFSMRIGINTGLVVVGRIGDDLTMEYTAMGDTVNLASRMESTAEPGTIQVSENTYRLTEGYFEFKPLGEIEVKGKKEPVKAYQLLGTGQAKTRLGVAEMRGLTRFVGRQKELDQLMDCYGKAKVGQGQVVGIVGEPGVGKSRLLLEFRNTLPQGEYSYLEGDCLHYGGSIAYLPFLDIFRAYFDFAEGEQESLVKSKMAKKIASLDGKLQGILPPLQDVLSLKVQDEEYLKLEPQQRREQVFEAIRALLIRESLNRPLILAMEDLHWIDNTSEEFLTYFIDGLANTHILLILLYRPEYTPVWVSKSYYSQIRVDRLPTGSSSDLVQAIMEGGEVAADLRTLILTRASGNPLFIEEFTRTLLERGYVQRKDGHYVLTVKPSDIQVPDTIQGIIAARIDRLDAKLKQTMQVASVIGKDFAYRILQTITVMKQELKAYMLTLQELEFIYEKSLFPELEYIFKHALTQEVAYNSLLIKRRKEIHEKIGQAIEQLYPERLEEFYEILAHHYSKCENWEKAYQYLKLSGYKAIQNYSLWEALSFYKEAIQVLSRLPDTDDRKRREIEVRLSAEPSMKLLGYPEDSIQILRDGERLSKDVGDTRSLANFYSSIGFYYLVRGDAVLGRKYAEDCFREAEKIEDIELMAPVAFDLCMSYAALGDWRKLAEVAPRIITMLKKKNKETEFASGPFNMYSALSAYHGYAMAELGNIKEGEALCHKALRFAIEINSLPSQMWAELWCSMVSGDKGDWRNAIEHLQRCVKFCEENQMVVFLGMGYTWWGLMSCIAGDLESARKHVEEGIKADHELGISGYSSRQNWVSGWVHLESGNLESAITCLEEALQVAQQNNEKCIMGNVCIQLGRAYSKADESRRDRAKECILEGIRILDEAGIRPWCSVGYLYLSELYSNIEQREEARETLKKAEGMFKEMGMDYWLVKASSLLHQLQGQ